MISVIICSYRPQLLLALRKNIEETIGVPFEIIALENPSEMGICKTYNLSVEKAQYNIICFCHEDLEFKTPGWGNKVVEVLLNKPDIGLMGVVGSMYKSFSPSHWSFAEANYDQTISVNYIQRTSKELIHYKRNPLNQQMTQVATIDGMFMCARKDVCLEIAFDENLEGFHGYDIDFSIAVNQRYKVLVTQEILIEHFSEGTLNPQWVKNTLQVHKKWSSVLPINLNDYNYEFMLHEEYAACKTFMKNMLANGYSMISVLLMIARSGKKFSLPPKKKIKLAVETFKNKYAKQ